MKTIKARWRIYTNLILLSAVLITSFQNCSKVEAINNKGTAPVGVEIVTE